MKTAAKQEALAPEQPGAATFGAAAPRLLALGYMPCAFPGAELPLFACSESPAAVRLGFGLAALVVSDVLIADAELRARACGVLKGRGLLSGPHRVGSDGRRTYPLRCALWGATRSALDGAVELHAQRGTPLPLDGAWPRGTLLDVSLAELPQLVDADAERLFAPLGELVRLTYALRAERAPPPQPSRMGWLGRQS